MTATTAAAAQPASALTVREVAARLGLTPWSVYQMVSIGVLAALRTGPRGRTLRVAEEDLLAYQRRVRTEARV